MKSIFNKAIIFLFGLALLFPLKTIYLLNNDRYKKLVRSKIVYNSIDKSKSTNKKIKKIIIGDSVGQQLFSNYDYNDSIYSLTTNQAISLTGQYILLNNALNVNSSVEKVVLLYTPFAFKKDLNQRYTYQYFLKPFFKDEYKNLFSAEVKSQIKQIPYYYLSQFPPVLTSNWSPDVEEVVNDSDHSFISPLNDEYLTKIIALCNQHSVRFVILPPPTRVSKKSLVDGFRQTQTYKNYDFNDYFSKIAYIPDTCFYDDVHLKDPQKFNQLYIGMINGN